MVSTLLSMPVGLGRSEIATVRRPLAGSATAVAEPPSWSVSAVCFPASADKQSSNATSTMRASAAVSRGSTIEIGRIEVVLPRDPYQGEESISASVGQRGTHAVRGRGIGEPAYRPIGGNPLARGMGQDCGQVHGAGRGVDRRGLNRCDL